MVGYLLFCIIPPIKYSNSEKKLLYSFIYIFIIFVFVISFPFLINNKQINKIRELLRQLNTVLFLDLVNCSFDKYIKKSFI